MGGLLPPAGRSILTLGQRAPGERLRLGTLRPPIASQGDLGTGVSPTTHHTHILCCWEAAVLSRCREIRIQGSPQGPLGAQGFSGTVLCLHLGVQAGKTGTTPSWGSPFPASPSTS